MTLKTMVNQRINSSEDGEEVKILEVFILKNYLISDIVREDIRSIIGLSSWKVKLDKRIDDYHKGLYRERREWIEQIYWCSNYPSIFERLL